jgi:hypothetical protein
VVVSCQGPRWIRVADGAGARVDVSERGVGCIYRTERRVRSNPVGGRFDGEDVVEPHDRRELVAA